MKERKKMNIKGIRKFSFYKKKNFYVVLTVLFSLILLADIAIAALVPASNGTFGNMPGSSMERPDRGEMTRPDGTSGRGGKGTTSGDAQSNSEMQMPVGDDQSRSGMTRPDGTSGRGGMGTTSGDAQGNGGMQMPTDRSDMQTSTQSNQSFLQTVKAHWVVIFIIFAILDVISIVMLVWTSKIEKKQKLQEMKELREKLEAKGEVVSIHKPAKKEKNSNLVWIIVVVGIVLLVVVVKIISAQPETTTSQTEATVYSGKAESGSISSVVPGTGTLTDETAETITLPANVEITKWYISNGDTVEAGDKLGQVNQTSVMTAITEVQEKLTALDEELAEHADEEIEDTITASTDGRVKAIYAEDDTSVVETMYNSGALMRISLDGMMAVSMETELELSPGDIVTVTLSDSTTVSGKVESMTNKTAVITLTDEGITYGETVSVATADGTTIGTGELYIHSELKVTGYTGTVSGVEVEVEEEISSGDTLLTLEDTEYTGEYEALLEKREELETQLQELFQLYQDQYVYASCAGVISGLGEDTTTSASEGDSAEATSEDGSAESNSGDNSVDTTNENSSTESADGDNSTASFSEEESTVSVRDSMQVGSANTVSIVKTVATGSPQKVSDVSQAGATTSGDAGKSEETTSKDKAESTEETASKDTTEGTEETVSKDKTKDTEETTSKDKAGNPEAPTGGSTDGQQGTMMENTQSESATSETTAEALEEAIEETYSVTETTWLSIIPQETMDITITVDELDILSLEEGQEALVTLDAFPGQSFEGEVTSINLSGTNSGGSSKYTAVVSIKREEKMLAGMNASVVITISTKENVLVIPESALLEQDGSVYVYTSYNEDTETFGDMVEVTTGASDGENVEILSGLSEGSEYWYSYLDVVNYSTLFSTNSSGSSFSMDSLFGGSSEKGSGRGQR